VSLPLKAALSLLISVFLFIGVAVFAYTGLFDIIEAHFYNPSIAQALSRETAGDAEFVQNYISDLQDRFSSSLLENSVRGSFLPAQSADDVSERSRIYGLLTETVPGLQSVRFVDKNGARIHFSTYNYDILSGDGLSAAYRDYTGDPGRIPFEKVYVPDRGNAKIILDGVQDRVIFSFPFSDSANVYRGTALFTVSARALVERLFSAGRIKIGDDISVIGKPQGILYGSSGTFKAAILDKVSVIWDIGLLNLTPLNSSDSGAGYVLVSAKTSQGIFYGRLVNAATLSIPRSMKVILLLSVFLTLFLAIFLLFNLKQDPMAVIRNRLKILQVSLIEQFYERKSDMDWLYWIRGLEFRRNDILGKVKQGLKTGHGGKYEKEINTLINNSWNELLGVISAQQRLASGIEEEGIEELDEPEDEDAETNGEKNQQNS